MKMIKEAIHQVVMGNDLDRETAVQAMREIMSGEATPDQIAAFITALRMKGETIEEITACAMGMREKGVVMPTEGEVMEIVGTGGDEVGTFNISTTAAFVIAAAGVPIAKHGNRSVSSQSGAADVLERLGVNIRLTPEQCAEVLKKCGMSFMFAQVYHPAMKYAGPVRKDIGIRTVFNILGPLTNPAKATMQLMGVYDDKLVEPLAQVLMNLGVNKGMVVCGASKLDEATISGKNLVCEIKDGKLNTFELNPEDYGFAICTLEDLIGGTPEENAQITKDILTGKLKGAKREVVILNTALCLCIAEKVGSFHEGIVLANEIIDSGKAEQQLEDFIKATNAFDA